MGVGRVGELVGLVVGLLIVASIACSDTKSGENKRVTEITPGGKKLAKKPLFRPPPPAKRAPANAKLNGNRYKIAAHNLDELDKGLAQLEAKLGIECVPIARQDHTIREHVANHTNNDWQADIGRLVIDGWMVRCGEWQPPWVETNSFVGGGEP